MIRYDIDANDLRALVDELVPGWIARARTRTDAFRDRGKYEEEKPIWSEIKPIFMQLQGDGKCCFCERKFESGDLGRHELDIEHFRPKGNIRPWSCPQSLVEDGVALTTPPDVNGGYYLLPYNLLNYAVACKACNSGLKKDHFPIAGAYDTAGDDPTEMAAERALADLSDRTPGRRSGARDYVLWISAAEQCRRPDSAVEGVGHD